MIAFTTRILLAALLLLPGLSSLQAQPNLRDYYVVELIVFSNDLAIYKNEENWQESLVLQAPEKLLFPANIAIEQVYPELHSLLNPSAAPLADTSSSPFLPLLGDRYLEHKSAAARINRAGRHRLLTHQSWLQKLEDENTAPSIAILAGDQHEGFYEISGSIKLFRSRFLHLHTDLWRVYFQNHTGETNTDVPAVQVTLPLIRPPSLAAANGEALTEDNIRQQLAEEAGIEQLADLMDSELLPDQPLISLIAPMQQKRRMRSREIHHIDHPLFGLIIEIRPFELP